MRASAADMCQGPILKKAILYTIPIILTGLLQLLFNAADLIVVGRFCGSVSVAAVGATGAITNLIVNMFIGLSVGAGVGVAQALGANDWKAVRSTIHTAIPLALGSGVVLTVVGVILAKPLLALMGTPDDVINLSAVYMQIYFCGMTSSMLYNYGSAILRAAGDTKGPLYYLTIAGVVNVVLNFIFVTVFHMDVAGVALATAISQTLSAVLVIWALMKRDDACHFDIKAMKIEKAPLLKMMRIGVPAGIQGSLFSISNVIIQSSINSFGSVAMSGNAAAGNIEGFVYVTMNAFHQTALNFAGQNYGAKKYRRLLRICGVSLGCVCVAGIVAGGLGYTFARPLLGIYITDSLEAIEYGVIRMGFVCLPYFLCGIMDVMTGLLRGMGSSIAPMLITVLGVCGLRIVWIYTVFRIPAYHSLQSLYFSYPLSWLATFLVQITVFFVLYRKLLRRSDMVTEE